MTIERSQPYIVRCFIRNPGGAYDPAPLTQFDQAPADGGQIPQVGDILRWDENDDSFRVVARYFDYFSKQCAVEVTAYDGQWIGG